MLQPFSLLFLVLSPHTAFLSSQIVFLHTDFFLLKTFLSSHPVCLHPILFLHHKSFFSADHLSLSPTCSFSPQGVLFSLPIESLISLFFNHSSPQIRPFLPPSPLQLFQPKILKFASAKTRPCFFYLPLSLSPFLPVAG